MTEEGQNPGAEPEAAEVKEAEEIEEAEDVESLKKALAEAKEKVAANLAGWQRAQADFINYKRRCEQEKEDNLKFANSELVKDLLPVLDDLERAFTCMPPELGEVKWVEGMRFVERKLKAVLEAKGLSEIKAVGEPFDPQVHEAITQMKGKEGTVILELQKGYKFRDKVIRPSKVAVGNGEEGETAEEKKEA